MSLGAEKEQVGGGEYRPGEGWGKVVACGVRGSGFGVGGCGWLRRGWLVGVGGV